MPLLAKLVRRPIKAAACAVAVVVLAQLNIGTAAAVPLAAPGLLAAVGGSTYLNAVAKDSPTNLWQLNDTAAGTSLDSAGTDNLTMDASVTRGAAGAMTNDSSTATTFSGAGTVPAATSRQIVGLQSFSVEAWFKTTSTTGGKIIGFGNSRTGNSTDYDRHLYLTNAGNLTFGVYPTTYRWVTSPLTYNNGEWHHVVGAMSGTGMDLFVDGRLVGHDTSTAGAELYSGYWRVGGDNLSSWPSVPTKHSFSGALADVAVYSKPLTLAQVQAHYGASGRTADQAAAPADSYGAAVSGDSPFLYWRLDETSGTAIKDQVSGNPQSGTASTGTVLGEAGSPAAPAGKSIRFPGTSAQTVTSNVYVDNPTTYSLETWFKSTSGQGGRLIGFGNERSGNSSNYDRQITMLDSGKLQYGIYSSALSTITSPLNYNDGKWHHVVATQGPTGQQLFVDGTRVTSGSAVTPGDYAGYWRLGTDRTWSGASSDSFAGSLDEVAVYSAVLPAATVAQHYQLGKPVPPNVAPTAAFSSSVVKLKVSFDGSGSADSDGTIASYDWDFGDGTTGTGVSPAHAYPATGTYTAVLTVTDDKGAKGLISHTVTVTANAAPAAAFSTECTDLDCAFDATASTDSDGRIASYAWDFGDGESATGVTAKHSFTAGGSYDVVLLVTDDDGDTDKISQTVAVTPKNNPPTAALTAVCKDLDCTFDGTGSADPDGSITEYAWDFGDGKAGAASAGTHSYADAGVYTVTLTVTDDRGATGTASIVVTTTVPNQPPVAGFEATCTDLTCTFDAAKATDPDGSITGYEWDFGDGQTSTEVAPTHVYAAGTYTATLVVTDDDGATGKTTQEVTAVEPNKPPVAAFTATATDLSVVFDATGSTDSDGRIVSYDWAFGDGASGTAVSGTHTYKAGGTYTAVLKVTDDDGASDSVSATVTVIDPVIGADSFTRTVTAGLGTADVGGAWTFTGSGTTAAVADGSARITLGAAKPGLATLTGVKNLNTELSNVFWLESAATGTGVYFGSNVRITDAGLYRARVRILSSGSTTVQFSRAVGNNETVVGSAVPVPGLTYTAGTKLRIRTQAFGSTPTTLRAKVWVDGKDEPAAWTLTQTDSTSGFQTAGSVGMWFYGSGTSSTSYVHVDDLQALIIHSLD